MRITVDSFILCGLWIGALAQLAYDAVSYSQPRPVRLAAIVFFTLISFAGMAWRRYWKDQIRRQNDHAAFRKCAREHDQAPE